LQWRFSLAEFPDRPRRKEEVIFFTAERTARIPLPKIRFLTADIAMSQLRGRVYKNEKPLEDTPTALPLLILRKENGKWRIAVFQNTPVIRKGELVVGRTENKND
jgi:hypothetical protein